jgi:hypothetical protein
MEQLYGSSGELPVRSSLAGQAEGAQLADLAATLGSERIRAVMSRIDRIKTSRGCLLGADSCSLDSGRSLSRGLAAVHEPLGETALTRAGIREWIGSLNDARRADPVALRSLLSEFEDGPLPEHRTQVIHTALSTLDFVEPLICGLWAEALSDRGIDLRAYRVQRDDFDLLKSRYVDIFELAFRSLVFMARVVNIARRGNPRAHADGYRASLRQAMGQTSARDREQWLLEFPLATQLYGRLERATRNDISHGYLRHDPRSGEVVYRDGVRESYLRFLIDYLCAVRLTHYLVDVLVELRLATHETSMAYRDALCLTETLRLAQNQL